MWFLVIALLLPCPQVPEGDSTRLPQGCAAPVDGWLWTRPADAHREARLVELEHLLRVEEQENAVLAANLDLCAEGCDLDCPPILPPPPTTPAWVWASLGAGAPLATVGVCSILGCDMTTTIMSGILSGALTIGVAAW